MPFRDAVLATPAQHSSLEMLSDFAVFTSTGDVVPAIHPGEPVSLRWQYAGLIATHQVGATIKANVLTKDRSKLVTSSKAQYAAGGVAEEIGPITSAEPAVNRIGDANWLVLQAQVDGIEASLSEALAPYAVVEEPLADGHRWNIVGSGDSEYRVPTFFWKQSYLIASIFTNISPWITLSGTASLLESSSSSGPWSNKGTVPIQLTPGRSTDLVFPERKQEWGWLAPAVFVVYGDLYRAFFYTVELKLTDNFGNSYSLRTAQARIAVVVSERKMALGYSAMVVMAIALVLYLISWLVTPVPAGTVQGIAAGLGSAALDPPKPSKKYKDPVSLPRRVRIDLGAGFEPLAAVMAHVSVLAKLDKTLYAIEARILGARDAEDRDAAKMQVAGYVEATRAINAVAADMSAAVDVALDWLARERPVDQTRIRAALASMGRDRPALRKGRREEEEVVRPLLDSPELVSEAMKGLEANLVALRSALLRAARYAARDALRIEADFGKRPMRRPRSS